MWNALTFKTFLIEFFSNNIRLTIRVPLNLVPIAFSFVCLRNPQRNKKLKKKSDQKNILKNYLQTQKPPVAAVGPDVWPDPLNVNEHER